MPTCARPRPVLPAVASTIVPPGLSLPSRSAASIIDLPMRSLIEPPGFWLSSLTNRRHGPVSNLLSSTIGVSPIRSSGVLRGGGRDAGGGGRPASGGGGGLFGGGKRAGQTTPPPPPWGGGKKSNFFGGGGRNLARS